MDNGMTREEAEKAADAPRAPRPTAAAASSPAGAATAAAATTGSAATRPPTTASQLDLTKITFPVLAINGEFDRPLAKTHRMWRELRNFRNVILPGKSHLTAIAPGYIPKAYIDSTVEFITTNNPGK